MGDGIAAGEELEEVEAGTLKASGETLNSEVAALEEDEGDAAAAVDMLVVVEGAAEAGTAGRRTGWFSGETRAAKRPSDEVRTSAPGDAGGGDGADSTSAFAGTSCESAMRLRSEGGLPILENWKFAGEEERAMDTSRVTLIGVVKLAATTRERPAELLDESTRTCRVLQRNVS